MCCCMFNFCIVVCFSKIWLLFAVLWCMYRLKAELLVCAYACTFAAYCLLAMTLMLGMLSERKKISRFCSFKRNRSKCGNKKNCGSSSRKYNRSTCSFLTNRKSGSKCRKRRICSLEFVQDSITYFCYLYALPCLVTDFLYTRCFPWQYATLPLMITIFPTAIYLIDYVANCLLLDSLIMGNVLLITVLGWNNCCIWAVAAGWIYLVCHFVSRIDFFRPATKEIIYNVGMSLFCFACLLALGVEIYSDKVLSCFKGWKTSAPKTCF